jgi:hypothetical protein
MTVPDHAQPRKNTTTKITKDSKGATKINPVFVAFVAMLSRHAGDGFNFLVGPSA